MVIYQCTKCFKRALDEFGIYKIDLGFNARCRSTAIPVEEKVANDRMTIHYKELEKQARERKRMQ